MEKANRMVLANCPVWSCVGGEIISCLCDPQWGEEQLGFNKMVKNYIGPQKSSRGFSPFLEASFNKLISQADCLQMRSCSVFCRERNPSLDW